MGARALTYFLHHFLLFSDTLLWVHPCTTLIRELQRVDFEQYL